MTKEWGVKPHRVSAVSASSLAMDLGNIVKVIRKSIRLSLLASQRQSEH